MPPSRIQKTAAKSSKVQFLRRERGRALFDRVARRRLGVSGEEAVRRWDAGYGKDPDSVSGPIDVWMLPSFARQVELVAPRADHSVGRRGKESIMGLLDIGSRTGIARLAFAGLAIPRRRRPFDRRWGRSDDSSYVRTSDRQVAGK